MNLANDFFQNNLALLKRHHPQTWEVVMAYHAEPLGELCLAEDGLPNLLLRKDGGEEILLHDATSPTAELARYYALVPEDAVGVVVFIGMGLGHTPLAMIQSRRQVRHIAIFEPEIGIFVQALHALDLTPLLADQRTLIAVGPDIDVPARLDVAAKALQLENVHILVHTPSFQFHPEAYQSLHHMVFKYGNAMNIGGSTTRIFGRKFVENRLNNLSAVHHQQLLEHLKDTFTGVPAIIVAGGPSLNKNIHLLPQAKGKAVIIAADTVLPALLAHGVTPEFTTSIDMQDITIEKIIGVAADARETSLVCASWVSPLVVKNFPARQAYWSFTAKNMENWLNTLLGGKIFTAGAGTVAHLSFTTAYLLGCSPIVFLGQDLAFTNQQDHAQHTALTSKNELEGFYENNEIEWVAGYGGSTVPTTRAWLSDKHHFERSMASLNDRTYINATEGGVLLDGTEQLALQEVLTRFCGQEIDIASIIDTADKRSPMPSRRRLIDELARMLKVVATIEKEMSRLEVLIPKISREIEKLHEQGGRYHNFDSLPIAIKRQINALDSVNNTLDEERTWALLDEVTMDGLLTSERLNHEILQLQERPERYLEWLGKSVERFAVINQCRRQVLAPFKQQLQHLHRYLQRENMLLKKLAKKADDTRDRDTVWELLKIYEENGEYALLEKTITTHNLKDDTADTAELAFYLGAIAAHQSQFDLAEHHFSQAAELAPSWSERIADCRHRLGDRYLAFGRQWQVNDRDVARRMLLKGIRLCPLHPSLRETLAGEVELLLIEANAAAAKGSLVDLTARLSFWCQELAGNAGLRQALGQETAALLYRFHGIALIESHDYPSAIKAFAAAITRTPQNPDLYLLYADAAFAVNDFTTGITSLDRAVKIDRSYGKYWEHIGDNLFANGQAEDAVAAYEKCFIVLPEKTTLLKKIGDCYLALDQPEAAREAYRLCQEKMLQYGKQS